MTAIHLAPVESIVTVAAETGDTTHALALLRARSLTADPAALDEAVRLLAERDRYLGHDGDPWTRVQHPARGMDIWETAAQVVDLELEDELRILAVRRVEAVAS